MTEEKEKPSRAGDGSNGLGYLPAPPFASIIPQPPHQGKSSAPSPDGLLGAILPYLDRGPSPNPRLWPDAKGEYHARCPFHPDRHVGNFSVSERGYKCFACGASGSLAALARHLGIAVARLHGCSGFRGDTQKIFFLTLEAYAQAKQLPRDFLVSLGLYERKIRGAPAVCIPYFDADGERVAVRYRLALQGDNRFRWAQGSKVKLPYGLWRLQDAQEAGYVVLVEGESDAQTLWYHGVPALGVPGASTWKPEWATYLQGLAVYIWQEPDSGGDTLVRAVGESLPDVRVITPPPGRKDISECHLLGEDIPALMADLRASAKPYQATVQEEQTAEVQELRRKAAPLLECPDVLGAFLDLVRRLGLAGEERNAKLLYLALTSRLLDRPVSVGVKGPSAAGKSRLVETVLRAFPESAYYALTSMSEHALAYSREPLQHRFLVLYEAAGLSSDFAAYLVRSLLSEGRVRYETVEKTADGLAPRLIEREGPTGLVITTTWASLHPENETRILSLTVRDDREQTKAVLMAQARNVNHHTPPQPDLEPWHAFQRWLELAGERRVTIPYSEALAERVDPAAVRVRRDFLSVLQLVQAHAILHQAHRERDEQGRMVATLDDYAAVYGLVADIVGEGAQAAVSDTVRETVQAVAELASAEGGPVQVVRLAQRLGLDKSAAWRRVRVACELGYLVNLEDRRGKPARLVLGDPLPEETPVLPRPEDLETPEKNFLCIPPGTTATVQPLQPLEPSPGGEGGPAEKNFLCIPPAITATVQPLQPQSGTRTGADGPPRPGDDGELLDLFARALQDPTAGAPPGAPFVVRQLVRDDPDRARVWLMGVLTGGPVAEDVLLREGGERDLSPDCLRQAAREVGAVWVRRNGRVFWKWPDRPPQGASSPTCGICGGDVWTYTPGGVGLCEKHSRGEG